MIELWYSCCGGRSWPQSKNGFTTTEYIVWREESSSLNAFGSEKR